MVDRVRRRALVDTGCTRSILGRHVKDTDVGGGRVRVETVGAELEAEKAKAELQRLPGIDLLIGMDVIDRVGGVSCGLGGLVEFAAAAVESLDIRVKDKDFAAVFNGKFWEVS
ncbi:hypothetical protein Ciccas_012197 [Cichlidogyrus casuarinus]|uniref:Aspartyl protease n=1 Tax=Cichlidogyrus casuarinus TaxID=1844966 RepID=A0ABD2PP47_9PLAT